MYNRAFHPPLLLSGAPRVGAHVRVSYIHQRTGRGPYRAGFVLSQLVAATHSELSDGGEPGADFDVLWSSDVEVTPISKGGGAVSFGQEIDLPEHLPGPGPVATSGQETFKEVVWYLRTREVLWPRSGYTYQFVLPVEPAPGRQGPAVTPH